MSVIKTTTELIKNFEEISKLCRTQNEHIFITNNGKKDLVILSIDEYERICALHLLYQKLDAGMKDIREGRVMDIDEAFAEIEKELNDR